MVGAYPVLKLIFPCVPLCCMDFDEKVQSARVMQVVHRKALNQPHLYTVCSSVFPSQR